MNQDSNNTSAEQPYYTYTTVSLPARGWRWGHRGEVRVYRSDVHPQGRGYADRVYAISPDCDSRYRGPRSAFGQAVQWAQDMCQELNSAK